MCRAGIVHGFSFVFFLSQARKQHWYAVGNVATQDIESVCAATKNNKNLITHVEKVNQ